MTDTTSPASDSVPFAVGGVFGIRAFTLHTTGQIASPLVPIVPFAPGVNYAKCTVRCLLNFGDRFDWMKTIKQVAGPGHSCGFYAYFANEYCEYVGPHRLTAVVQGYGTVTYGSHGFRAEKLRILAAVNPHLPPARGRRRREALWRAWHRMVLSPLWVWVSIMLIAVGFSVGLIGPFAGVSDSVSGVGLLGLGVGMAALVAAISTDVAVMRRARRQAADDMDGCAIPPRCYAMAAERYPDIAWFPTVKDMLAAYPLTRYSDLPAPHRLGYKNTPFG